MLPQLSPPIMAKISAILSNIYTFLSYFCVSVRYHFLPFSFPLCVHIYVTFEIFAVILRHFARTLQCIILSVSVLGGGQSGNICRYSADHKFFDGLSLPLHNPEALPLPRTSHTYLTCGTYRCGMGACRDRARSVRNRIRVAHIYIGGDRALCRSYGCSS